MKLLDILVQSFKEWDWDYNYIAQDGYGNGCVYSYEHKPYFNHDDDFCWVSSSYKRIGYFQQAEDWRTSVVTKEEFMQAKKEKSMKKEFTKADMKDGMRCVLRNGDQMFWNAKGNEHPMILGSSDMDSYDNEAVGDDLLNKGNSPGDDIVEVYALGELVWKRDEESEEQKKLKEIYSAIEKLQEQAKAIVERK